MKCHFPLASSSLSCEAVDVHACRVSSVLSLAAPSNGNLGCFFVLGPSQVDCESDASGLVLVFSL